MNYSEMENQAITTLRSIEDETRHIWIFTKAGNFILIISELFFYFLMIGLIIVAFKLPDGRIELSRELAQNVEIETKISVKEILDFYIALKIVVIVIGFLMFYPAVLLRKLRSKNHKLERVNDLAKNALSFIENKEAEKL